LRPLDGTNPIDDLVAEFSVFMDAEERRERLKRPELESMVCMEVRAQLRELTS
jgi:hypothetical protein